ncbi:hypothetical protein BDV24DRAFT_132322 [Aspergillus arachidicola]|uniref:Uncharacterized protein n=1 Tax=Aspergillus arachidicola TaxID=656916 RepID=A0A5N6Y7A6_9EURO|nr:hypothetical protein BDV24DRAFT_132322 [Aspergillus arachidicola]
MKLLPLAFVAMLGALAHASPVQPGLQSKGLQGSIDADELYDKPVKRLDADELYDKPVKRLDADELYDKPVKRALKV